MTALNHILIAIAYTLVAAAIAVLVPRGFPEIGANAGAVIGGVVLLGSALMHEVFSRQESQSRFVDEMRHLRLENDDMRSSLDDAWSNVAAIRESLTTFKAEREAEGLDKTREVDSVIAEVKVLQGLIEQFSVARSVKPKLPNADESPPPNPFAEKSDKGPEERRQAHTEDRMAPVAVEKAPYSAGEQMLPVATGLDDDAILSIVRDGLEKNCVDLVLQPIVRLPQRKRAYFEAFTRIRDQNGSMLVPSQYIAIAEREGLVAAIDNMMLFRCVQLVRRTQKKNANIGVFCNISAHSLTDRHFFSNFIEFMADNTALAADLIFEFPYATIANRDDNIEQHLRQLASLGFRFSVDQVSSLHIDYGDLMRHRFKYVKIDTDVMLAEVRNPSGNIAIEDIKRVVDRHGMDLIVEKIEKESDLLELLDLRVDFGQGYLFGAPRLTRIE
jgi:cyclic-di-GMP phosphodiesterase TipF (flagellum assembly factor)